MDSTLPCGRDEGDGYDMIGALDPGGDPCTLDHTLTSAPSTYDQTRLPQNATPEVPVEDLSADDGATPSPGASTNRTAWPTPSRSADGAPDVPLPDPSALPTDGLLKTATVRSSVLVSRPRMEASVLPTYFTIADDYNDPSDPDSWTYYRSVVPGRFESLEAALLAGMARAASLADDPANLVYAVDVAMHIDGFSLRGEARQRARLVGPRSPMPVSADVEGASGNPHDDGTAPGVAGVGSRRSTGPRPPRRPQRSSAPAGVTNRTRAVTMSAS
jgi:hypothetical protein